MKKFILIIMFCGLCCFLHKNTLCYGSNIQITTEGNNIVIKSGDNKFIAEITSDYKQNLRIYGINDNDAQGWSPLAYTTYILIASPFKGNPKTCEGPDAANAPLLNIIVENKDVKNKMEKLKKVQGYRAATLIGKNIRIKKFFYKNEDHSDALAAQDRLDPHNAIMINDIIAQ